MYTLQNNILELTMYTDVKSNSWYTVLELRHVQASSIYEVKEFIGSNYGEFLLSLFHG